LWNLQSDEPSGVSDCYSEGGGGVGDERHGSFTSGSASINSANSGGRDLKAEHYNQIEVSQLNPPAIPILQPTNYIQSSLIPHQTRRLSQEGKKRKECAEETHRSASPMLRSFFSGFSGNCSLDAHDASLPWINPVKNLIDA